MFIFILIMLFDKKFIYTNILMNYNVSTWYFYRFIIDIIKVKNYRELLRLYCETTRS